MQIQGSVAELAIDVLHRDGSIIPMLFNAVRRQDDEGLHDDLAAMVLRNRQQYENELRKASREAEQAQVKLSLADRRKDEFIATLSHELRNPLAPMVHVVRMLQLQQLSDPRLAWARDVLDRQVGQLRHLVDDLLEASRITQGKLELRRERLDIARPLRVAIESVQPQIDAAGHRFTVSMPALPLSVDVDPTRLAQMVLNLLNNAAKYTPDGGRIRLEVSTTESEVLITLADNGTGIGSEHLPQVFEMFSQFDHGQPRQSGGLGIGLSLVQSLAKLHGGGVDVQSDGLGRGCEFTIRLPRVARS